MTIILIFILACICGVLGRLGGAAKTGQWYDFLCNTKARDVGCSICTTILWGILFGIKLKFWWVYIIVFGLHWGAFTTYWDFLFKFDNLWFSGFVVGLCALPFTIIEPSMLWFLLGRCIVLAIIWGLLDKYLPSKIWVWNRDVAEEFLRYKSVII